LSDGELIGPVPQASELEVKARHRLEDDVAAVLPVERRSGIRCRAERNHPVTLLVEASADADLLVVGPRGQGRVASLVLGSVSLAAVHQAKCPVVVVQG
jgi:nucleotide-binding universal stress UspA family protein